MWFIAELVEVIAVDGVDGNTTYVHSVLLGAEGPEEAYNKALEWAKDNITSNDQSETTIKGERIHHVFAGLKNLEFCSDSVDPDGIIVECKGPLDNVREEQLSSWIKSKSLLDAFIPLPHRFQ